jgi:ribosomal protein S17
MSKDQLKEERMRVLDLLAKGVITSDEAEKLLSAMDRSQEKFVEQMVIPTKKLPFRMLRMYIDSKDGDVVKIQIPIEFAKLLKTQKFNVNLKENDIDIDAILEMVNQGFVGEIVNIESADGDIVKIVVE